MTTSILTSCRPMRHSMRHSEAGCAGLPSHHLSRGQRKLLQLLAQLRGPPPCWRSVPLPATQERYAPSLFHLGRGDRTLQR